MKDFIKKRLHEHFNRIDLSKLTDTDKGYLKIGLDSVFDEVEDAASHLYDIKNMLKKLPNTLTLYRVVFVNNVSDIDTNKIGSHFVLKKHDLENTHAQGSHVGGGNPYIIMVSAPKNLIDIGETIKNNMQYPHENEITLKNNGVGAKIVNIKPFKSLTNYDLDLGFEVGEFY